MNSKDKRVVIINFLKENGPSLIMQIAKAAEVDSLFAGAFLAELYKEKEIIMSHMKVGSSPLYLLRGQEPMLEKFIDKLNKKEKEACLLLKKHGILEDNKQTPAIRVALRNIQDFASAFKLREVIYWRYFILTNNQVTELLAKQKPAKAAAKATPKSIPKATSNAAPKPKKPSQQESQQKIIEELAVAREPEIPKESEIRKAKVKRVKKVDAKQRFLDEVQEYLQSKGVEVVEIDKHDKKQIVGRVRIQNEGYLLVAFNKKRFTEADLLRVYRKNLDTNYPFYFLSKGELSKKTAETVKASKRLKAVGIFSKW